MAGSVYAAYSVRVVHHSHSWIAFWPNLVCRVRRGRVTHESEGRDGPDEICSEVGRVQFHQQLFYMFWQGVSLSPREQYGPDPLGGH